MLAMDIALNHNHVAIRVVDYAGTLRWYMEKLDFPRRRGMGVGRDAARLSPQREREGRDPGRSDRSAAARSDLSEINRNLAVVKDNSGNLIELSAPRN